MSGAPVAGRVVGIVPAAGRARRLGAGLEGSKELLAVYPDPEDPSRTLPVCYRLLHALGEAEVAETIVVLRAGKEDLEARLRTDASGLPAFRLVVLEESPSPAFTVAAGTRAAGPATVALGFPDVLWEAPRAFARLLEALERDDCDAALGLFPPAPDYPTHGVELDAVGNVVAFADAEVALDAGLPAWTLAVWRPRLSRWLEAAVEARYGSGAAAEHGPIASGAAAAEGRPGSRELGRSGGELGMTEVFRGALAAGFQVRGVRISEAPFLDVGSPARLAEARRRAEVPGRD